MECWLADLYLAAIDAAIDYWGAAPRSTRHASRSWAACAIFGALYEGVDLYDTYPPIRQQLRWLTGGNDLDDACERLKAFR